MHPNYAMGCETSQSPPGGPQIEEQLHRLIQTGALLASEASPDAIAQTALDAGLHLCGARFGAFLYHPAQNPNPAGTSAEPFQLYKIAGPDIDIFQSLLHRQSTGNVNINFLGQKVFRSGDITHDPLYGQNPHFLGIPQGHPPIRSFLAVPVRNRSGSLLGLMIYGHPERNVFPAASEDLAVALASQVAVALENILLSESLHQATSLLDSARSLRGQTANHLRLALDAAQLGTFTWDRATDRLLLDERAATLLHAQPHVPIRRTALRIHLAGVVDQPETSLGRQRLLASGGLYNAVLRIDSPEGIQSWVAVSGLANFAPHSSRITGMIGTLQDITSQKTQEAALRQSEKLAATGRLAASIAHEINNPLEAVTNLIYLSRTDSGVPPSVRLLLEAADAEITRVAQIAQQTLGFYRDTSVPMEIDLNEILSSVVELFSRKMQSRKISCSLDLEPSLRIHGLRGEIRQVFSNLIVNAMDAFPSSALEPCRIHIRGRHLQGCGKISILIADNGSGIPTSARQHIFTPFFTTKRSVGTGLGLWVTRGFVEKHGGLIHFRSSSHPPLGTAFRIVLPEWRPSEESRPEDPVQHRPESCARRLDQAPAPPSPHPLASSSPYLRSAGAA
ncbi:MAG: ATP-binding protein [Acidobacteriaceae bacterium]